jgi:ELWxxDGT repeat protein
MSHHFTRLCLRAWLLCLAMLLVSALVPRARADGGPAFLVKDINTKPVEQRMTEPAYLTAVGSVVYFCAQGENLGRELWKSDGTDAGTRLVRDINPGYAASCSDAFVLGPHMADVNGQLFFSASDVEHDYELWKSDGTDAGTVLVKDIIPGPLPSMPGQLMAAGGTLFFTIRNGSELWRSDGTQAGTARISLPSSYLSPTPLGVVDRTLFFAASQGTSISLWKIDATQAGASLVKRITTNGASLIPLADANGWLFFAADDGRSGYELWKSDGTAGGTVRVKDINPGAGGAFQFPISAADVNGTLFFAANSGHGGTELWKSDGTAAGTKIVKGIAPGGSGSYPRNLTEVNGTLFFAAYTGDGVSRLWKSDGTPAGTVVVKDIIVSLNADGEAELVNVGETLFVSGTNVDSGFELWKSDGTDAGTVLVKDIAPHDQGSWPAQLINASGRLFFLAYTGIEAGRELWVSNGTDTGTIPIRPVVRGTTQSYPYQLTELNGTLLLLADDGSYQDPLWKSDGTPSGTVPVALSGDCASVADMIDFNGTLFFASGSWLCRSDGTALGTTPVKQIVSTISQLTIVAGSLYFIADHAGIWKSDGTPGSTLPATAINETIYGGPSNLTDIAGTLFFTTGDEWGARRLWKSDGTAAGTILIKSFLPPPGRFPPASLAALTNVGGTLFFSGYDSAGGYELWKSDGTPTGTLRVRDIIAGPNGSAPSDLLNVHGRIFFAANDGVHGRELWASDGSAEGTQLVVDIVSGPAGSNPNSLADVMGSLIFSANDGRHGYEIWRSDGTPGSATLIAEIAPGSRSSFPSSFTLAGDYLFFSADDSIHGRELWAIRSGVDAYVQAPVWAGAPSSGTAIIPIRYGNLGLSSATALTLTATLDPALVYLSDTASIAPTVSGSTIRWRLPAAGFDARTDFALRVRAPTASFGATYPITLTLAATAETHSVDNTARVDVIIARQVFLPTARR